ncbi:MAG: hypothetical protein JXO51_00995 [Candidatus Aminicenantes bacterium]|nr:hypothetical protein [Candidatus Aminicenantes bacterium]
MIPVDPKLPEAVGAWKKAGPPQAIHAGNIFDYMDGAGELYLAYRFDHMLAHEYHDENGNDIVAELYRMKESDDAFGLLSLDWSGEAVALHPGEDAPEGAAAAPPARALYGEGLLRVWSDRLYARVMAVRETPAVREAILELGALIVAGSRQPPPNLLRLVPPSLEPRWTLKRERTAFFRSHLVLNSLYYLSHENILSLDLSCAAVFTTYEGEGRRFHLLVIQYPGAEHAAGALGGFVAGYLPDRRGGGEAGRGFHQVEDGWLGFRLAGSRLVLAFACPDGESAQEIVDQVDIGK